MKRFHLFTILVAVIFIASGLTAYQASLSSTAALPVPKGQGLVVIGWNNLGMHCYHPDFNNLAIFPPYNTLVAQVAKIGDPPQIITSGVVIDHSFPENTYSVGKSGRPDKTNFWKYANALFGVSLQPNIGLAGTMDKSPDGDYYVAEGMPLTNIRDQDAATMKSYRFQKAQTTAKDSGNPKKIMAQLTVIAPVSTEFMCGNCHRDE